MSAVEIEDVLLKHPDVQEAAVIGAADALRGQVVKAFIVTRAAVTTPSCASSRTSPAPG